jgi:hypothetical protein
LVLQAYRTGGLEAASEKMLAGSRGIGMDPYRFAARCHDIAHALGKSIDLDREVDLETRGPSLCRSGFFHGVHLQRFSVHPTAAALVAAAPFVCAGSEALVRVGRGGVGNGCRHALGHELYLRGLDHVAAAAACETPAVATHNPESAVSDCLYGLYMEVFLRYESDSTYTDPRPICLDPVLTPVAAFACTGEAGLSLYRLSLDTDPRTAFAICAEFATKLDAAVAGSCAGGLGRSAGAFLENRRDLIESFCREAGSLYENCLIEAAAAIMEAEQDYSWATVCTGLSLYQYCESKMADIKNLVETRL